MQPSARSVKEKSLAWGRRTYLMGVLNITPDSFSGDGLLAEEVGKMGEGDRLARILAQARDCVASGADILDVVDQNIDILQDVRRRFLAGTIEAENRQTCLFIRKMRNILARLHIAAHTVFRAKQRHQMNIRMSE